MNDAKKTQLQGSGARIAHGLGAAVGAFVVATVGLSVAILIMGGEPDVGHAANADPMNMFNVTTEAAFSVASAVVGLVLGLAGIVTAAGAAVMGLAVGAMGIVGAVIIGVGMVAGPLILLAAIALIIKRRFYPDVI